MDSGFRHEVYWYLAEYQLPCFLVLHKGGVMIHRT